MSIKAEMTYKNDIPVILLPPACVPVQTLKWVIFLFVSVIIFQHFFLLINF